MNALLMQALRREAQNHFARRMSQVAVSDWTSQERAEAARLGFCRRLPERREYTIKQLWGYGAG